MIGCKCKFLDITIKYQSNLNMATKPALSRPACPAPKFNGEKPIKLGAGASGGKIWVFSTGRGCL